MSEIENLLYSFVNYEKKIGNLSSDFEKQFQNFKNFTEHQGNFENRFQSVHIVGSKGKGSIAHLLSQLMSDTVKTGLFISPHLSDVSERICINNEKIQSLEFKRIFEEYKRAFSDSRLSYFEILTFLSFVFFKRHQAEWGIFEAGLGGRLDATNVIQPRIIIITTIEKEHENILGSSIEKIAEEKTAVIKQESVVFSQTQHPSIKKILKKQIEKTNSILFYEKQNFQIKSISVSGSLFVYKGQEYRTSLNTEIQLRNLELVLDVLTYLNIPFSQQRLKKLFIPGRFEIRQSNPVCLFDTAHTPASFQHLTDNLNRHFSLSDVVFILNFYTDKKITEILTHLKKSGIAKIYYAETGADRSYSLEEFQKKFSSLLEVLSFHDITKQKDAVYIFTGSFSLYTVFENFVKDISLHGISGNPT